MTQVVLTDATRQVTSLNSSFCFVSGEMVVGFIQLIKLRQLHSALFHSLLSGLFKACTINYTHGINALTVFITWGKFLSPPSQPPPPPPPAPPRPVCGVPVTHKLRHLCREPGGTKFDCSLYKRHPVGNSCIFSVLPVHSTSFFSQPSLKKRKKKAMCTYGH